ncbi:Hpt domain-containing protein [Sulfurimonas aquatica]|uniref:Hpt domain-containing protein n=1 Tax=Sulfurimonas aquatica TaxID=2672570 RepID=A0A975AY16_9BACT|nr:Hpt domain-containing protein [Sulfurimonas aquatica]QSZ40697.1 Hpt domain-containing protein [Sulfurimonas aquatica]
MPITNPNYDKLDYEKMAETIGLKAKHIPVLMGSFLEESAKILARLESAVEPLDFESLKLESHSMKGSAGNLLFKEIYEMAKEIEIAAEESDASFPYKAYHDAIKDAISTIKL